MITGTLTPLQLIAGSSLLQNQGLVIGRDLTVAEAAYSATPLMTAFFSALSNYSNIATLGANSVPSFSNSVPAAYSALGTQMTTVVNAQASKDLGSGDISKFVQAFNIATAYIENTNLFINSAVNSQNYLGNTFSSTNNQITGDITTVNLATTAFGSDLTKLGYLIDLATLENLGSPFALVQRIVSVTGNLPVLAVAFLAVGVPQTVVVNLTQPSLTVTDSVQKLMYQAMTKITGASLAEILQVLKVTTTGIETMADLLNPAKLFPTSYQSLTVVTSEGQRAIYLDNAGTVNSKLATELPPYVISSSGVVAP